MSEKSNDEGFLPASSFKIIWNTNLEGHLLGILREWKLKEGAWSQGKFAPHVWPHITAEFNNYTGKKCNSAQLQSKYQRLREQYHAMRSILDDPGITGIGWNSTQCNIDCTPEQWCKIKERKPLVAKHLNGNKSLPHYTIMGEVFWDSGAQGTFSRSSKEPPLTDEQENDIIAKHKAPTAPLPFPQVINVDDAEGDPMQCSINTGKVLPSGCKRKSGSTFVHERKYSSEKRSKYSTLNDDLIHDALEVYVEKARMKRDMLQAGGLSRNGAFPAYETPSVPSFEKCMEVLFEECPEISGNIQLEAGRYFERESSRKLWMAMNSSGRKHLISINFAGFDL